MGTTPAGTPTGRDRAARSVGGGGGHRSSRVSSSCSTASASSRLGGRGPSDVGSPRTLGEPGGVSWRRWPSRSSCSPRSPVVSPGGLASGSPCCRHFPEKNNNQSTRRIGRDLLHTVDRVKPTPPHLSLCTGPRPAQVSSSHPLVTARAGRDKTLARSCSDGLAVSHGALHPDRGPHSGNLALPGGDPVRIGAGHLHPRPLRTLTPGSTAVAGAVRVAPSESPAQQPRIT